MKRPDSGKVVQEVSLALLPVVRDARPCADVVDVVHVCGVSATPTRTSPVVIAASSRQITDVARSTSGACSIGPTQFE